MTAHANLLKILLVHNFYGSSAPSGENQVFEAERQLLTSRDHEVFEFTRHSDEIRGQGAIGVLRGAAATIWNPISALRLKRTVLRVRPDIVHVHNTFPLISPSIFSAIGPHSARVLTLHNYRLFCAAGVPFRSGRSCIECLDSRSAWPAVRHACYRESRLATLPLAFSVGIHRLFGTWTRHVDGFIALSEFQRSLMASSGLPIEKIYVKANSIPGKPSVIPWKERLPYAVFAGRLGPEKGVKSLLHAWRAWGVGAPELRIVGDGTLRSEMEGLAKGLNVCFMGQVSALEAQRQIAAARLVVLPSECIEGFPMVVGQAFAFGTPAAVSDAGPLPTIVKHGVSGVVFSARSVDSILREIRLAWETPEYLEKLGLRARAEYEIKYTEDANYAALIDIYKHAIAASCRQSRRI